jgi:hypothetical protein
MREPSGPPAMVGRYSLEIPLPKTLPTTNQRRRWHWGRERAVAQDMRTTAMLLGLSFRSERRLLPAKGKRWLRYTLVRGKGQKLIDADSIQAALKNTTDGLVDAKLLAGDSEALLDYRQPAQERGEKPIVVVEIGW